MGKIFLYGIIGSEVEAKDLVRQINETPEGEAIDLHINSPGGDVYDGFSIYNALQSKKKTLSTYIDGLAYSAASWLALAAKPQNRFMSNAAQFGIHRASNFAGGNTKDLKRQMEILEAIDKIQIDIYTYNTELSQAQIEAIMDNDKPMSLEQAAQFGFTQYEPEKAAAIFNYNNMDLLEKLKKSLSQAQEETTPEAKAKAKEEVKAEVKKAETPAQALSAEFAKKEDLITLEAKFKPLIEALVNWVGEAPTKDDVQKAAKDATNQALTTLLKDLKQAGEVTKEIESNFDDTKKEERLMELKPDKASFKGIFETQKQAE